MAYDIQSFDYGRAKELGKAIKDKINEINKTLVVIRNMVAASQEWWIGASQAEFVANFDRTKAEIYKGLDLWLKSYEKLLKEVEKSMVDSDDAITKALK
jgi:uncharacterized protein YukE